MHKSVIIALSLIFLVCSVQLVQAAEEKLSLLYTGFNKAVGDIVVKDLTKSYTNWKIVLNIYIVINATTNGALRIQLVQENVTTPSASTDQIMIIFDLSKMIQIYWVDDESSVKLGNQSYTTLSDDIVLTCSNGYFSFGNSSHPDAYIDNFVLGTWAFDRVAYYGETDAAESGYCTVIITKSTGGFSGLSGLLAEIMPLMMYILVIGAVFGMIGGITKKMGKW